MDERYRSLPPASAGRAEWSGNLEGSSRSPVHAIGLPTGGKEQGGHESDHRSRCIYLRCYSFSLTSEFGYSPIGTYCEAQRYPRSCVGLS